MRKFAFALLGLALVAQSASAATVTVTRSHRAPTATEIGNDAALAGKTIYDFFVTTSGDILSINEVTITLDGNTTGTNLYQNLTNGDVEPPNPIFVNAFPALAGDSWISTPGGTSSAGGGFSAGASSWFDSDVSPASTNFNFARLTTSGMGTFNFNISVPSDDGSVVETFAFSQAIPIPEPATFGLASSALLGLAAFRRRK